MKPKRVCILFDSHTPYLAFRVNALQHELLTRGWGRLIELHVILIGADEKSYQWNQQSLQDQYTVPLHVLSESFHGLGLRSFFHPSLPGVCLKLTKLYYKLRPKVMLVGGYDRPESILCRLLSYTILGKVGVMHDSRFNDAESFSKNIWLEFIKSLVIARYSFFMVPGRECADYTSFLAGRKKPVYRGAWNVVDNVGMGRAAEDASSDASIYERFQLAPGSPYFFLPARFVTKKNIPFVIGAYAEFLKSQTLPRASAHSLVLCGQGPLKEEIEGKIRSLGLEDKVKLCAWLPYELMPRASRLGTALLLPSLYDQWGMTPLISQGYCWIFKVSLSWFPSSATRVQVP
jgi:1,2-diacylglycerol 3-alpha-glucosyltransferase